MYVPEHFAERDVAALHGLVRARPFALLTSARAGEAPVATHLPLLLDEKTGGQGMLVGHVARANPHWRHFDGETPALAVFQGPHAYVSARWYGAAKNVPTWNYLAVHVTGRPRVVADTARVFALLRELMGASERGLPEAARAVGKGPRELADIPFAHLDRLARGIVAFELPIERISGKRKLSQNKKPPERRLLAQGLRAAGHPDALEIAALIETGLDGEGTA
jgi:transcriptional regulator